MPALSVLLLAAYAVPYAARVRTLGARGRSVPRWRVACFAGGLVVLAVAVSPPIGRAADARLSLHMVEHVVLGDLAPLLVVLGLTGPLLAPLLRGSRAAHAVHPVAALPCGRPTCTSGTCACPTSWRCATTWSTCSSMRASSRAPTCGSRCSVRCRSRPGSATAPGWPMCWRVVGRGALANAVGVASPVSALCGHGRAVAAPQGAAGGVMLVEQSMVVFALLSWLLVRMLRDAGRGRSWPSWPPAGARRSTRRGSPAPWPPTATALAASCADERRPSAG